MEATTRCSSVVLIPPPPFSFGKTRFLNGKRSRAMVFAARRDSHEEDFRGRSCSVDESMIILRKRIHEMKVIERNYEPPEEWMEWEKQYYACYDEYICDLVGLLQSYLMNTRPSLALGLLALVTLSVPASTAMILLRLMEVANGVFSVVHHV